MLRVASDEYARRVGLVLARIESAREAIGRAKDFHGRAYQVGVPWAPDPGLDTALAELVGATAELRQLRNECNAQG